MALTGTAAADQDDDGRAWGVQNREPQNTGNQQSRVTGRCPIHGRTWAKGPEGRAAHPIAKDEGGGWCFHDVGADAGTDTSAEDAPLNDDSLVGRLGKELQSQGVSWPKFLPFLGVETWPEWEERYGGPNISDKERMRSATLAAWRRFESDAKERERGCHECGQEARRSRLPAVSGLRGQTEER